MTRISDDAAQMNATVNGPIGGVNIHDKRGVLYVDQSSVGVVIEANTDKYGHVAVEIDASAIDDVIAQLKTIREDHKE